MHDEILRVNDVASWWYCGSEQLCVLTAATLEWNKTVGINNKSMFKALIVKSTHCNIVNRESPEWQAWIQIY